MHRYFPRHPDWVAIFVSDAMKTVIAANGILEPNIRLAQLWCDADLRIAADGGARNAHTHLHLAPHIVIGDFDSIDADTLQWLKDTSAEMIHHPPAKDQTDLELAIDLAQTRRSDAITILAALGGRPDQMLANVLLLTRSPRVRIAAAQSEMWLVQHKTEILGVVGDTVSLIPLSAMVAGIQTVGLKYPLNREALGLGATRGVSNELVAPRATVQLERGMLLVVHLVKSN